MYRKLRDRLFPLQITKRFYLGMAFLIIVPILVMEILDQISFMEERKIIKEKELFAVVCHLNRSLQGSYDDILKQYNIEPSPQAKLLILNSVLQPIINQIAFCHTNLIIGYYSSELDSIVASNLDYPTGKLYPLPHTLPYFDIYKTGNPQYFYDQDFFHKNSHETLSLVYPLHRQGKLIGHVWASRDMDSFYQEALARRKNTLLAGFIMLFGSIFLSWIFFTRFKRDLNHFANAIGTNNLRISSDSLPELNPLVELIYKRENELKRELEISSSIAELSSKVISTASFNEVTEHILDQARKFTDSKLGYVGCLDPMTGCLTISCLPKGIGGDIHSGKEVFIKYKGLWGWVLKNKKSLLSNNPEQDYRAQVTLPGHVKITRFIAVPAIIDDQLVGQIALANAKRDYTPGDLVLVERFARLLVILIHREHREEALRMSEDRFAKAFNTNPCMVSITTLDEGRFIDVNKSFLQTLGYEREDVIGHTSQEIDIGIKSKRKEVINSIKQGKPVHNLEVTFYGREGNRMVGLYSAELIKLSGESCLLSVVNDITKRKQLEKEMIRLDRLNMVGEMAAGIAHEVRNPLTTVRGFLQMLGKKNDNGKLQEYYALMIEELDRANTIISEFLSTARNKPDKLELEDLNTIIDTLFPLIAADAMNSDCNVVRELTNISPILLNQKEIRQLILNLAHNSLEAMTPGGTLTIKTFMVGEEIILSMADTGKGIETEILDKLGTPFFTTKENGTGLGLAVCYGIVRRHHASIEIDTSPKGTTFYIKFKQFKGVDNEYAV
ncbi:GAF sensor signal transduction histidine kinase [Desulforamulus reducens MI-1]|uniref:histidine kinase n=1 Tax=Desulforamulus reducens (strain ATCC BAA-1160 / DSM 100696 / MI-1) TaxID=349161 RepID=A4J6V0_DESRM|nr:GAF sensor signal transduction histidine kinase [Desulforamulus reducens MI-1]